MTEEFSNTTLYEILIRIEKKVDKTNGRVRRLEVWKGFITGGLAILSIFSLPIIIPAILKFFK